MADHLLQGTKPEEDIVSTHPSGRLAQTSIETATRSIRVLSPGQTLPEGQRLVVLVPNTELTQDARLPQRIWQLASPGRVPVVFLAIAGDYDSESYARRRLTLLAAITRDRHVSVEIQVAHTSSWLDALQAIIRPGDVVLSHTGQTARKGLFGSEPLCDQLGRCLTAPVYLISGYVQDETKAASRFPRLVLSGAVLGLILAGFFALDAQVIDQLTGTLEQVMLLFLVFIEIGAIWVWNTWA